MLLKLSKSTLCHFPPFYGTTTLDPASCWLFKSTALPALGLLSWILFVWIISSILQYLVYRLFPKAPLNLRVTFSDNLVYYMYHSDIFSVYS